MLRMTAEDPTGYPTETILASDVAVSVLTTHPLRTLLYLHVALNPHTAHHPRVVGRALTTAQEPEVVLDLPGQAASTVWKLFDSMTQEPNAVLDRVPVQSPTWRRPVKGVRVKREDLPYRIGVAVTSLKRELQDPEHSLRHLLGIDKSCRGVDLPTLSLALYGAMLTDRAVTPGPMSTRLGVPAPRVSQAIQRMVAVGAVELASEQNLGHADYTTVRGIHDRRNHLYTLNPAMRDIVATMVTEFRLLRQHPDFLDETVKSAPGLFKPVQLRRLMKKIVGLAISYRPPSAKKQ